MNPLKGKYIGMVGVGNLTVDLQELRREENRELRAENKELKAQIEDLTGNLVLMYSNLYRQEGMKTEQAKIHAETNVSMILSQIKTRKRDFENTATGILELEQKAKRRIQQMFSKFLELKKMFYEQPEDPLQIKAIKRDLARFYGIKGESK